MGLIQQNADIGWTIGLRRLQRQIVWEGLAQRASSRARHRGPPFGFGTESFISDSACRAPSRLGAEGILCARHREPPIWLEE